MYKLLQQNVNVENDALKITPTSLSYELGDKFIRTGQLILDR